jgi:hypothetical protein
MSTGTSNTPVGSVAKKDSTSYVGYGLALVVCMSAFGNMFYMKRFKSTLNNPANVRAAQQSVEVIMHPEKFVRSPAVKPYKPPAPAPTHDTSAEFVAVSTAGAKPSVAGLSLGGSHPDIRAMRAIRSGELPDPLKDELVREIIKKHVKSSRKKL